MARRARLIFVVASCLAVASCASVAADPSEPAPTDRSPAIRLLLVGDAMLGRGVAPIVEGDAEGLFRDVRSVIRAADVAAVNVESPLTNRAHVSTNPYELEASPSSAGLLAMAGFDVAGIANNHAGDAGPDSILDSIDALEATGIAVVGGGPDVGRAREPVVVEVEGVRIAFLAFDVSGQGLAAGPSSPGVVPWDEVHAHAAVEHSNEIADVVVVGIHGGVEYFEMGDPLLMPVAETLARWDVDVIWGHGPHVEQPIRSIDPDGDGRSSIVSTSLGNFIFDQQSPATSNGLILEVLVDRRGVVAHRVGDKHHDDLRVHFSGWRAPEGDVALLAGSWWSLDRPMDVALVGEPEFAFAEGEVVAADAADLDGDGTTEVLVSYRHPRREKPLEPFVPPATDTQGRSAHLGVVEWDGTPVWLSRRPPHPIGDLAACDGTAAFAYTTLDDDAIVATGGGVWGRFGFVLEAELPGPGTPGCSDVDGDGRLEAVIIDR